MKINYNAEIDALNITFCENTVITKHAAVEKGIALGYGNNARLVEIEILDVAKRFGGPDTLKQITIEGVGLSLQHPKT